MATDDGAADHRSVFCNDPDPLRDRQFKFMVNTDSSLPLPPLSRPPICSIVTALVANAVFQKSN